MNFIVIFQPLAILGKRLTSLTLVFSSMKWRTVIDSPLRSTKKMTDAWHDLEKSLAVISIKEIPLTDGLSHRNTPPFQSKNGQAWAMSYGSIHYLKESYLAIISGLNMDSLWYLSFNQRMLHTWKFFRFRMETGKIKMWTKWKGSFSTIIHPIKHLTRWGLIDLIIRFSSS